MGVGRQESLWFTSPTRALADGAARSGARTPNAVTKQGVATEQDRDDAIATFHFDGPVEGAAAPGMSTAQQNKFKADFYGELASVRTWSVEVDWSGDVPPALQVFVSADYKISKSLVPAWYGHRGHMEFPTWRVIVQEAAIAHELIHVYFPNGNRLLAEGLAIYLQAKIGGNRAFPNFGRPLHELARELLREMVPEFACGDPGSLAKIDLAELDKIATPEPLLLTVGRDFYDEDAHGQARIYPIAGSFVQFLIETQGMDKFRTLYARTPLAPLECNAGSPDRWLDAYGLSLAELEGEWKSLIVSCDC
jgi:hypothetical protein